MGLLVMKSKLKNQTFFDPGIYRDVSSINSEFLNLSFYLNRRKAIAHIYESTFLCASKDKWCGRDGIICKIKDKLNFHQ